MKSVALEAQQKSNLEDLDEIRSGDEIGDFAEAFKNMLVKLRAAEEELRSDSDKLELLVKTRTRELEFEKKQC